jgi:small subunit ribosomal protein S26e
VYYSISAAIHSRIVRVRSRKNRRNRQPPVFLRGGGRGGGAASGAAGGAY